MIGRLFVVAALVLPAGAAGAQGASWTAADAVANALSHPAIQALLEGRMRAARAEVEAATVVPTPTLGVAYEQVFGDERVAYLEASITVEQRFDLSRWRDRLRGALPDREGALRAEADGWRLDVASAVRTAFFEVRYREERGAALDGWIARLERGAAATAARQDRGDASRYEVRRVERELETARAQRAREEALLAEAWAALRRWSPWDARPRLSGELTPAAPGPPGGATVPRLARLERLERALSAEVAAWGEPFWRGWTVGAGYRFADVGEASGHGVVVSLSLPLTLWNNDRPEVERLGAERARVGSELRLARAFAEQAEVGDRERLERVLEVIAGSPDPGRDAELTGLAEAAYGAGEATLTELLDAYGSETDLALARIDLQWEARRAAIALERGRGQGGAE